MAPFLSRTSSSSSTSSSSLRPRFHRIRQLQKTAYKYYAQMTVAQRLVLAAMGTIGFAMGVVMVMYKEQILAGMVPLKSWMHAHPFSWLLLISLTSMTAFPPMIGYSTTLTLSGFIYGFPYGWFPAATATIIGSLTSFHICRTRLRPFTARLLSSDPRFANLSLAFENAGIPLLVLLRLSPLPYSLSNGALALVPGVTYKSFLYATCISTPKLLLHIFIGSRLALIAEEGGHMSTSVKIANWIGILIGLGVGVGGGMWVYRRMQEISRGVAGPGEAEVGLMGKEEEGGSEDEDGGLVGVTVSAGGAGDGARRRSSSAGGHGQGRGRGLWV